MADNNNRVLLNDDEAKEIAGGQLLYYDVRGGEHYLYSSSDPDNQYNYDYARLEEMDTFLVKYCKKMNDQQKIAALQEKGFILSKR